MAEDTRGTSGAGGQDAATGARPPAAGAINAAWGRTAADLAADQPAGHADANRRPDAGGLPGSDDVTGSGRGGSRVDPDTGGDIRRGRPRDLHPEVDPDARLGLRPTVGSDQLPDPPAAAPADARSRAAAGAVAGMAGAAVLATVLYAMYGAGQAGVPAFLSVGRRLLGSHGWVDHVLGVTGFLAAGATFGGLFGLLVARPTMLAGAAFGLLPALVWWLAAGPPAADGGASGGGGGTVAGIALPLLLNVLVWAGVGGLCHRWFRPPATADTSPTAVA